MSRASSGQEHHGVVLITLPDAVLFDGFFGPSDIVAPNSAAICNKGNVTDSFVCNAMQCNAGTID